VDLAGLLLRVLRELEASQDADKRALLRRLLEGTYTPRDTSDVADIIEGTLRRRRAVRSASSAKGRRARWHASRYQILSGYFVFAQSQPPPQLQTLRQLQLSPQSQRSAMASAHSHEAL
jgi:hypothetical protein